ncbi:hypothetical protein [Streptomyces sp. NPDC055506]
MYAPEGRALSMLTVLGGSCLAGLAVAFGLLVTARRYIASAHA